MHLLRKLSFAVGLTTLVAAHPVFALGLGESELNSALNQPLKADIRLTNLRGLSSNEIIVRLASDEDFRRAGLDRQAFYSQLDFELLLDHPDGPIVRVTTDDPVREPYLNFLVEARWATGRLLREYTLLLDLPTFDQDRQAQPVQAATTTGDQRPVSQARPQRAREAAPSRRESTPSSSRAPAYSGETYEVGANDTLWEIALRVRPGRDLSVQQTMLAIHRENPEAFINGNINLLREGQVLRLPSRSDIQGLNQQRAVREVAQHNREWSGETMGAQLDAGQRAGGTRQGPSDVSGRVRLAAPSQSEGVEAGQGGGNSTDSGAELEAELAAAQEELDKSRRENRELSARVEELESQIETMESLVEASNEQLAALQAAAAEKRAGASGDESPESASPADARMPETDMKAPQVSKPQEPASEAPTYSEPSAPESRNIEAPSPADETESAVAEDEGEAEKAEETARQDRNTRVVRSLPEKKSLLDHLMENLVWIAGGFLALLLGVYYFIRRRAAQAEGDGEPALEDDFEPAYEEEGFSAEDQEPDYDEDSEAIDLASEQETPEQEGHWEDDTEAGVEAETGDVVGEADIYIAYGKLDQAEELLLKGLDKEPDSPAILGKLLEVYAENRDVAAFDRYYTTLLGTDDRAAIQRAGELRDTIPGAGEFDISALDESPAETLGEQASPEPEAAADLASQPEGDLDFSFDLDESDTSEERKEPTTGEADLSLDDDFNFDLDDDFDLDQEPEKGETVTSEGDLEASSSRYDLSFESPEGDASEEEFALDFDLDDEGSSVSLEESDSQTGEPEGEESFPELDLKLDEDEFSTEDREKVSAEDDWNFDLESDDSAVDLESLDDDLSALDEEAGADETVRLEPRSGEAESGEAESGEAELDSNGSAEATDDWEDDLSVEDFGLDDKATSEDEQEAGQDAFADLDDALAEEPEGAPSESKPADVESPAGDADLELDDVEMGDMDLSSLDEEMSDLDADLGEESGQEAPAAEPSSSERDTTSTDADEEDRMFEEALSGLPSEEAGEEPSEAAEASEEDMDAELDFLADTDEAATKLDLARAYIDMGDADGARDILDEVRQEGNEQQQQEADELLGRIDA